MRVPWSTIGMAIDYRIRYYFAVTPLAELVAVHGGMRSIGAVDFQTHRSGSGGSDNSASFAAAELVFAEPSALGEDPSPDVSVIGAPDSQEARIAAARARQLLEHLGALTERCEPVGRRLHAGEEAELCRACYALALYEELARVGPTHVRSPLYGLPGGGTLDDLLALARPDVVDDLCQLSWAFYDGYGELLRQPSVLNPTFAGSADVGGADADLIVGGCLIDIKATVRPVPLQPRDLYQLVCYPLLDYEDAYTIDSVGIYLARQAVLMRWSLHELIGALTGGRSSVSALRRDLRENLRRDGAPRR